MTELEETLRFQEALRSELWNRAEAADREVSLIGLVDRRVRRARRRFALAASALTAIVGVGVGVTASVTAWPILQSAQGTAAPNHGSPVTGHRSAGKLAETAEPGIVAGLANMTEPVIERLPTASLQAVLLAQEPRAPVPDGWRWHDFGGIRFAAPASWVVEREGWWESCPYGVAPMTVLLNIESLHSVFGCGKRPLAATGRLAALFSAGVVVDAGRYTAAEVESAATLAPCFRLGEVRVCMLQPGNNSALLRMAVFPPESDSPTLVEIGLEGSAVTAQTIFDSIRPAPQRPFMNSRLNVTASRAE